uniref:Uncharacterized protein n=1 Tax=viral metagenome TaxID=1070528 RepID=A0A6M3JWC2_9ZZZZ
MELVEKCMMKTTAGIPEYLPSGYSECADENGVMRKYKLPTDVSSYVEGWRAGVIKAIPIIRKEIKKELEKYTVPHLIENGKYKVGKMYMSGEEWDNYWRGVQSPSGVEEK